MEHSQSPTGLGTALVTPFHADGALDLAALQSLVHWQIESGIQFLVPCGSTGEASTLSEDETHTVVCTVVEAAQGRVPVFAGSTHNSTAEAVRRAASLSALDGLTGVLTANPYYSKPNQRGQYLHFKAIAEGIRKPLLLYNIPGRTAANLLPETVLHLAEIPNIIGVKESSGNLQQIAEIIAHAPPEFHVFAGDDALALPVIAGGGSGLISVVSNALPVAAARMILAALARDTAAAEALESRLRELTSALFSEPNPAPVKAALHLLGRIASDALRLPMVPVEDTTRDHLRTLLAQLAPV